MLQPRVTICMMAYQHEKYIRQALDGIYAQTCQSYRLIAIDDGSSDTTYQILKEYESSLLKGKITVLTHPGHKNCGIYAGYRRCLENLNTEFFMPHASDDVLSPTAIEYLLHLMDDHPAADFAYGPCKVIDEDGHIAEYLDGTIDIGKGPSAFLSLLRSNPIREPTMFFRAHCSSVITSDESNIVYGDWLHNLDFFSFYTPIRYNSPVVCYRSHNSNVCYSLSQQSPVHLERCSEMIAAAISNRRVTTERTFMALLLISGLEFCPKPNHWPSRIAIIQFFCSLPAFNAREVARLYASSYLPRTINPFLVFLIAWRASSSDRSRLIKSYLLSIFRFYRFWQLLQRPKACLSYILRSIRR